MKSKGLGDQHNRSSLVAVTWAAHMNHMAETYSGFKRYRAAEAPYFPQNVNHFRCTFKDLHHFKNKTHGSSLIVLANCFDVLSNMRYNGIGVARGVMTTIESE